MARRQPQVRDRNKRNLKVTLPSSADLSLSHAPLSVHLMAPLGDVGPLQYLIPQLSWFLHSRSSFFRGPLVRIVYQASRLGCFLDTSSSASFRIGFNFSNTCKLTDLMRKCQVMTARTAKRMPRRWVINFEWRRRFHARAYFMAWASPPRPGCAIPHDQL